MEAKLSRLSLVCRVCHIVGSYTRRGQTFQHAVAYFKFKRAAQYVAKAVSKIRLSRNKNEKYA